ncbi:hypothetical protein BD560DRAFT_380616 [Blakeslea trispora]|nr:hypothetical protein BD560DRAFT_380616 [Blakeslea trispora]
MNMESCPNYRYLDTEPRPLDFMLSELRGGLYKTRFSFYVLFHSYIPAKIISQNQANVR